MGQDPKCICVSRHHGNPESFLKKASATTSPVLFTSLVKHKDSDKVGYKYFKFCLICSLGNHTLTDLRSIFNISTVILFYDIGK